MNIMLVLTGTGIIVSPVNNDVVLVLLPSLTEAISDYDLHCRIFYVYKNSSNREKIAPTFFAFANFEMVLECYM